MILIKHIVVPSFVVILARDALDVKPQSIRHDDYLNANISPVQGVLLMIIDSATNFQVFYGRILSLKICSTFLRELLLTCITTLIQSWKKENLPPFCCNFSHVLRKTILI